LTSESEIAVYDIYSPVTGIETVPEGEDAQIREIAELMVKLLEQRYGTGKPFLRGVHPKSHGCAKAQFTVRADLPERLQVGAFSKPGETYEAIIRFSNAAALVGPDFQDVVSKEGVKTRLHGSRGMAVKVRGLPTKSLASDEPNTQDFLMVNFPVFPFAHVADYLALTKAQLKHNDGKLVFPTFVEELKNHGGGSRAETAGKISAAIQQLPMIDPLASRYFSAAPFMFGSDQVMKFRVTPTAGIPETPLADTLDENYLRLALAKRLQDRDASFDFAVQVRSPSEDAHVEDVTKEWADIDLESVGTITIPMQEIGRPNDIADCEALFYTPWHSLPEHRPVGGINRLRLAAYQASVNRRRKLEK
jgi:catalase